MGLELPPDWVLFAEVNSPQLFEFVGLCDGDDVCEGGAGMVFTPEEPGGGGNSPPLLDIGRGLVCLLVPSLPSFFLKQNRNCIYWYKTNNNNCYIKFLTYSNFHINFNCFAFFKFQI